MGHGSYDKPKPYDVTLNGCIDGFSQHVILVTILRLFSRKIQFFSKFLPPKFFLLIMQLYFCKILKHFLIILRLYTRTILSIFS